MDDYRQGEGFELTAGYNESNTAQAAYGLMQNLLSRELHTAMPGRVEKVFVSGGSRLVNVQPLLRRAEMRGEQYDFPIAPGVLLLTIGTAGSSVLMPVREGDLVLLIYSERALEHWKLNTEIADTIYARQFDLSDAFAIPFNFKGLDPGYDNEDMIVEHNSQKVTIKNNGDIEVGGSSLKKLLIEAAADVFNNHVHVVSTSGSPAAQAGITSSPASLVPGTLLHVGAAPGANPSYLYSDDIGNNHMTTKVKAQ